MDTEDFIKKARKVHGSKYDYSKVNYVDSKTKVEIICPIHGSFWQRPLNHLSGHGCKKCGELSRSESRRLTKEKFIEKAKKIHKNKYDYSNVDFVDLKTEVEIICPEHGPFMQTPHNHLMGHGCGECRKLSISKLNSLTKEEFIERAKKTHGDKYDYTRVNYVRSTIKVEIVCHIHGSFWQIPRSHLSGKGCPGCRMSKLERELELYLKQKKDLLHAH